MIKRGMKDTVMKIFFTMVGIAGGFIFYGIYESLPGLRGALYIVASILLMTIIVISEKVRYEDKLGKQVREVANDIKSASSGNIKIAPDAEVSEDIARLYDYVEELRTNLNTKIRIQAAVLDIVNSLAVNIELGALIEVVLPRLVEETNSNWGVFYMYNRSTEKMELKRSVGLSKNVYRQFDIGIGEGFIGMAAMTKEIRILNDIPADTIFENRTFLGKMIPRTIMTVPILNGEELMAVLAFASVYEYNDEQKSAINILRNYLGFAVSNCITYERTQRISKELQFQNELIQNMNDELEKKVSERTDFLNKIINNIKDYMIFSVDKDGFITTWNAGAERIKGFRADEAIGRHITELYSSEEEKNRILDNLNVALTEGRFAECEWRVKKDGSKYFSDILITPIFGEISDLQGFTIICKDITDTKNLEQALLYEKAYNEKIVENSTRALLFADKNGIILKSNNLSEELLAPKGAVILGRSIYDFFANPQNLEREIKNICGVAKRGVLVEEILYKHDGIDKVTLHVTATDDAEDSRGVLLYLTKE